MVYTLRIKKSKTLKYILKRGKYCNNNFLTVHYTKNNKYPNKNFFAVCVSKKNGNSVQRNKLKRWAREAYKNLEKSLKCGNNILILYKKSSNIDNLNYHIVYNEMLECFKELEIYEY